jgi:hypothetical protein
VNEGQDGGDGDDGFHFSVMLRVLKSNMLIV